MTTGELMIWLQNKFPDMFTTKDEFDKLKEFGKTAFADETDEEWLQRMFPNAKKVEETDGTEQIHTGVEIHRR